MNNFTKIVYLSSLNELKFGSATICVGRLRLWPFPNLRKDGPMANVLSQSLFLSVDLFKPAIIEAWNFLTFFYVRQVIFLVYHIFELKLTLVLTRLWAFGFSHFWWVLQSGIVLQLDQILG